MIERLQFMTSSPEMGKPLLDRPESLILHTEAG